MYYQIVLLRLWLRLMVSFCQGLHIEVMSRVLQPKSVQEDLYSIASPSFDTGPHCYNQWSTAVEAGPAKARFSGECLREPGQDSDHIDGVRVPLVPLLLHTFKPILTWLWSMRRKPCTSSRQTITTEKHPMQTACFPSVG